MQGRLVAAAIAFAGICWSAPQAAPGAPPKLAVIIVVDQMRADYVDRFNAQWTGGLKRMVTQGAWFQQAAYPDGPNPTVKAFIDANPITADFGKTWDRMLPAASYTGPDDGIGEAPPLGWTRSFPHVLKGAEGEPDATYFAQWERSPFADA